MRFFVSVEQKKEIGAGDLRRPKIAQKSLKKWSLRYPLSWQKNVSSAKNVEKILVVDGDEPLKRPASDRVKATIPRTPAQHIYASFHLY